MTLEEAKKEVEERFVKNPWIVFLEKFLEMREYQKEYFKKKDKVILAKSKLAEMEADKWAAKLTETAKEKGLI